MPLIIGSETVPKQRRKVNVPHALRQLQEGTDYGRRQAALDLLGEGSAVPVLCNQLATEREGAVRAAILEALVSVGDETVVAFLIDMLRSNDAAARNEAVISLQALAGPVSRHMSALLADPDPDMRIMAVDVLRMLAHADAPRWLGTLLADETHPNVAGVAVDRLAEIGGPEHLPVLATVRQRFAAEPYITFSVDFVVDRIKRLGAEGDL